MKFMYAMALAAGLFTSISAFETYKEAYAAGQAAVKENKQEEAAKFYGEAYVLGKTAGEKYNSLFNQAQALTKLKKWDEAIEALKIVPTLEGASAAQIGTALVYAAHNLNWQGATKRAEATEAFLAVKDNEKAADGNRADAAFYAGSLLLADKKYGEALAVFQSVQNFPKAAPANKLNGYIGECRTYIFLKELDKAQEAIDKGGELTVPPNNKAGYFIQLGHLLNTQKKYPEAVAAYQQVATLEKVAPIYLAQADLYTAGVYYNGLKDMEKAKEFYGKLEGTPYAKTGTDIIARIEKAEAAKK